MALRKIISKGISTMDLHYGFDIWTSFLICWMQPAIVSNTQARSSFTERSLYPLPPATTDVLHTVFTLSLSSLCHARLHYAAKKHKRHMAMCWHSNYKHFHPIFYFRSHLFSVCWLVFNTPPRLFLSSVSVTNIYTICKFFKYLALGVVETNDDSIMKGNPWSKW